MTVTTQNLRPIAPTALDPDWSGITQVMSEDQIRMLLTTHIVSEKLTHRTPNRGPEEGYPMSLKDLVTRAADRIEKYGHCKGWYNMGAEGPCCIMGALGIEAQQSEHRVSEVIPAVRWGAGLGVHVKQGSYALDLIRWNDEDERTQAQVVEALRRAAGYL
jgi:hypothetical protein